MLNIRFFRPQTGEKTAIKLIPRLGAGGRGVGRICEPQVIEMFAFGPFLKGMPWRARMVECLPG